VTPLGVTSSSRSLCRLRTAVCTGAMWTRGVCPSHIYGGMILALSEKKSSARRYESMVPTSHQ
jgi:hypothetical protein